MTLIRSMRARVDAIAASPSKSFFLACAAFLLGVGTAAGVGITRGVLGVASTAFAMSAVAAVLVWRKRMVRLCALVCALFLFGIVRAVEALPTFDLTHVTALHGTPSVIEGLVLFEPEVRAAHERIVLHTVRHLHRKARVSLAGRVQVLSPRWQGFAYGDRVQLACTLEAPKRTGDFPYDTYMARYGIYTMCRFPEHLAVVSHGEGNRIVAAVYRAKQRFSSTLKQLLPEPHASFLAGIIYGERASLPRDLYDAFSATGVTHIIAISGYNISIITFALLGILRLLFVPRKPGFWIATAIMVGFVIFVGASASVVRAAVMGVLAGFAKFLGRMTHLWNALIFAAAAMVFINPLILLFDPGFQLSFAATVGLVTLGRRFERVVHERVRWSGLMGSLAATTLAAIIFTMPLVAYHFGRASVVALFVNVIILTVIPFIMGTGFFAVFLGLISLPLGQIIGTLPYLALSFVIAVIRMGASLPFASIVVPKPHWIFVPLAYLAIAACMRGWWRRVFARRGALSVTLNGERWSIEEAP